MITKHNVLLREILFLGSMLMIIIVTTLAWETVKTYTPDYTATVYLDQKHCLEPFSLANLVPKLSQDVCLGKGSGGTLTVLRYSFYLFSAAN